MTAIPVIVPEVECGERVPAARGLLADLTLAAVPGLTTQVSAAVTHLGALPGEFLVGVGDVGTMEQLERAEGPYPAPRPTLTG